MLKKNTFLTAKVAVQQSLKKDVCLCVCLSVCLSSIEIKVEVTSGLALVMQNDGKLYIKFCKNTYIYIKFNEKNIYFFAGILQGSVVTEENVRYFFRQQQVHINI